MKLINCVFNMAALLSLRVIFDFDLSAPVPSYRLWLFCKYIDRGYRKREVMYLCSN